VEFITPYSVPPTIFTRKQRRSVTRQAGAHGVRATASKVKGASTTKKEGSCDHCAMEEGQ
jgi:hypothetical protein